MTTAEERRRLIDEIIELGERESLSLPPVIPENWLALDLTMPQLKMLMCIYSQGPQRVSEIAASVGVSQAVVTGVADRLVHHGLVERGGDPHDRRVVICSLSDDGRDLAHKLWESGIDRGRKLMEVMTLEELQQIEKSAKPLAQAISKAAKQHQGNEAGFRRQFANLIDDIAEQHGIILSLREEYTVATGRAALRRCVRPARRPFQIRCLCRCPTARETRSGYRPWCDHAPR